MVANITKCYMVLVTPRVISHAHRRVFLTVNSIVSITTVFINTLVIVCFINSKKFRKPSYLILTVLSFTDCTVGILSNSSLSYRVSRIPTGCLILIVLLSFFLIPLSMSHFITLLAALERFIHIRFPEKYSYHVTQTRTVIALVSVSIAGILFGIFFAISIVYNNSDIVIKVSITTDISILSVITVLYVQAYRGLRRRVSDLNESSEIQTETENPVVANMQFTLSRSVLYILLSLWIGWGPYLITAVARSIDTQTRKEYWNITFMWINVTMEFNSAINAMAVIMINKEIRQGMKGILKWTFCG